MAKVTLFFQSHQQDEQSDLSDGQGKKPLAETPPVPNIDRASEIICLSDDVGQEAKRIRCQYTTKQKIHVVHQLNMPCTF